VSSPQAIDTAQQYARWLSRAPKEVAEDLELFSALLTKWQRVQNLVSRETLNDVWRRHIADSLQVLKLLGDQDNVILDLGSGGGMPAIPMAIGSKGFNRRFTLVEPNSRKVSFLRTVVRELGLPVAVVDKRSDEIDSRETFQPDVITSRALAPLTELCAMAAPFFGPKTRAIFHKGREHVDELAESSAVWHHDVVVTGSDTDPQGVLLELKNLSLKTGS
jgi:16S rRNA (guanine527-N7)-methyltransferase